jgi:hypothetical protein
MRLSLASSSIALALLALPAYADNKADAKIHIDGATAAHKEGQLGRCEQAITFYEQFIATKPAQAATDSANQAIVTCRVAIQQAQSQAPAKPVYEPSDAELPPVGEDNERPLEAKEPTPPQPTGGSHTPWYKAPVGLSLLGVGTASLAAGVVLYLKANSRLDDVAGATSYEEARSIVDDAHGTRAISVAFTAAGAGLIAAGIVYYVKRDSGDSEPRALAVTPTTSGGLVTLSGRF